MKKSIQFTFMIIILSLLLSGCGKNKTSAETPSHYYPKNNSKIHVDTSNNIRINIAGRIPIHTDSIKDILMETGRFQFSKIPLENGIIDYRFSLDKNESEDKSAAGLFYSVLPENSTNIISYNFRKVDAKGNQGEDLKWGLDVLLHLFGTELTDKIWDDILDIASMSGTIGAMGKDYEGYKNETCGIRLVYADLGENVQIDIWPY